MAESVDFMVVINDEGQYSIWPSGRPIPDGWSSTGVSGSKERCLSHIESVWTDMRPRRLREVLAERKASEQGTSDG